MKNINEIIPGLIISTIIGFVGIGIAKFIPSIGAASFAIIIGIILGNTVFTQKKYSKGFSYAEKDLLSYSIVLMGGTINFLQIAQLGFNGVLFIAIQMTLTIIVTYFIGKQLKFSSKYSMLMCTGNAVCGSSAIAAVSPCINADDKDKAISVTVVNLTGTILMFTLPILTSIIYGHATTKTSAMIGGTLQSIGQVIASAKFINDDVVTMSTIFKIIRIMFLIFVVMTFSKINYNQEQVENIRSVTEGDIKSSPKKSRIMVPWYITGFFIFCVLNSFGLMPNIIQHYFKSVSGIFEIVALAAIGLKVKFVDLVKEGPKAMTYGILVGICQVTIATVLISVLI